MIHVNRHRKTKTIRPLKDLDEPFEDPRGEAAREDDEVMSRLAKYEIRLAYSDSLDEP
jgi:hypothetical protein